MTKDHKDISAEITPLRHRGSPLITGKHLTMLILVGVSVVMAAGLLLLEGKYQLVLLPLPIAAVVGFLILREPFLGVYMFYLYEFLRPYDFIPALQPLRLAMVIVLVSFVSWVYRLVTGRGEVNWSRFTWFFSAFIVLLAISVVTSLNNRHAFDIFHVMAVTYVMFVVATNTTNTMERLKKLIWLLLLIHGYFAIIGIYNFNFGPGAGGQSTSGAVGTSFLGDENDFAMTLNVMIPLAFFLFEHSRKKFHRVVAGGLLVLMALGVVSSFSRGGMLGLAAVLAFCIAFSKRKLLGVAAAVLLMFSVIAFAPSSYWEEASTITDTSETTASKRINYWKAAVRMYLDHPVIGVGAGNGGIYLPSYMTHLVNPGIEWGRAFHGTIPQLAAELGTIGMIIYLGMVFFAVRYLRWIRRKTSSESKNSDPEIIATALIGGLIGYFVSATFISTVYYPQLYMVFTLAIILYHLVLNQSRRREKKRLDGILSGSDEMP